MTAALAARPAGAGNLVLVIMPVFGHAALMHEAVASVRAAEAEGLRIKIIVSVDGDPQPEIFHQLLCLGVGSDDLHVVFGPNGGPGAARNRAIEYGLRRYPDASASYFLDADNRVLPPTLRRLHRALEETGAGWAYTNIDGFGVEWRAHYGLRHSRLAHCVADNICDTGSLVSQAVFRAGVRFHEDRANGFEDWDFWLSCIERGFRGVPCQEAGFEYRLRAESRFKEANRSRGASLDFLHRQHRALFRRATLVGFEHEEAPRFALLTPGREDLLFFSDPSLPMARVPLAEAIEAFWGAEAEPDNHHFPPFLLAADEASLRLLQSSRMFHNVLCHAERLAASHNAVFVQAANRRGARAIRAEENLVAHVRSGATDLALLPAALLREAIRNDALEWLGSIAGRQVWPTVARLEVSWPLGRAQGGAGLVPPEQALVNLAQTLAASPLRRCAGTRWTWRAQQLPSSAALPDFLRRHVGGQPVLPLGPRPDGRPTAAVLVPIASFGGAEKVAYALARELRADGHEVHLFVLGTERMAILDEFDRHFDHVHFWARGIPVWSGSNRFLGHDFADEGAEADWEALRGLLSGFDLVVNNHVMVAHSVMAKLRKEGTRTVCYLHVLDETPARRPAGQPYAAAAFEHVYDAFVTCSEQLRLYLHGLGVPRGKCFVAPNGPGFSVEAEELEALRAVRAAPRGKRPLRLLYLGRLDPQKGIDRLLSVFEELQARGVRFSARVVGGELMAEEAGGESWGRQLSRFGTVSPPAFASREIFAHLAWADLLLVPSRWEGAPLVLAEAQMAGCVPLAADVGAVGEMVCPGEDGLLFPSRDEAAFVAAMADAVAELSRDGARVSALAEGALRTAARRSWRQSFAPFLEWSAPR